MVLRRTLWVCPHAYSGCRVLSGSSKADAAEVHALFFGIKSNPVLRTRGYFFTKNDKNNRNKIIQCRTYF